MTWLEKFKADHPEIEGKAVDGYIVAQYCPNDKLVSMNCEETDGEPDCDACWRRRMPEDGEAGPDR